MLRAALIRSAAWRCAHDEILSQYLYSVWMSFIRIKTIQKNGRSYKYLYRQTSIREGKKVRSKMEYLGAINGGPGVDWHHPADDRHDPVKLQEEYAARQAQQPEQFNQDQFLEETDKEKGPDDGGPTHASDDEPSAE
jgi:hypothetical protein